MTGKAMSIRSWNLDPGAGQDVIHALGELVQDLGGAESISAQQRMLAQRAVFVSHRLIEHESAILNGGEALMTVHEHVASCNSLLGLLRSLGLQRKARDVGSLQSYLAASASEPDDAADGVLEGTDAHDS